MPCWRIEIAALVALLWSGSASAADLSAEAGIVSDYRYRGLSLSDGKPAAQFDLNYAHDSGVHGELWASTIKEPGFATRLELEAAAGYSFGLADHLSLDLTGTYYVYPGDSPSNYGEISAALEYSNGPSTLSLEAAFAPPQHATRNEQGKASGNFYLAGRYAYEIPKTPVSLSLSLGRERGAFDEKDHHSKWDWSAGADLDLEPLRMGVAYSASNAGDEALSASLWINFQAAE